VAEKNFTPDIFEALDSLKVRRSIPVGALLFQSGRPPQGVYLIESGQVLLLLSSGNSRQKVFETVECGGVLGLSETLTGETHKLTAKATCETEVSFVKRSDMMRFLRSHHEYCLQIVCMLSEDLHTLYRKYRTMEKGREGERKAAVS
jgi:CRP-like cAMP-binding protein